MKLAFREELTPGDSLPAKLAWLEKLGIEGIELSAGSLELPEEELKSILNSSGVEVANVSGSPDLLHPEPAMRDLAMEVTRQRLHLAGDLGAKAGVLVVPQFGQKSRFTNLSPFKTAIELETELFSLQLSDLASSAREAGVPIFLEPLNRYEAHLVKRLEDGVAFAKRVGPEVEVMADFFHMNIEEADIAGSIREAGQHIVYVHVADSNRLQPGRGHLDFRPGFEALKEVGYDGFLGIECGIAGAFDEAVSECAALLREMWAAA